MIHINWMVGELQRQIKGYLCGGPVVDADEFRNYLRQRLEVLPGVRRVECVEDQDGCIDSTMFYAWLRLSDGAGAVVEVDSRESAVEMVSIGVVEGA